MDHHLEDFLDFCKYRRSLSENTCRAYRADLAIFLEWLSKRALDVANVRPKDIDDYLISVRKEGNGVSTANRKMYCLKAFYRWLQRIDIIDRNPLELFQNVKEPKRIPKYLTLEDQDRLVKAASRKSHRRTEWIRMRDHLLIILLLDSGLRISEACDIRLSEINSEGILKVHGKGNKEREAILSDRVKEAIKEYVTTFEAMTGKRMDYLFCTTWGEPLGTRHVFRMVRDLGKRAKIVGLHPHTLRHTFATNLRRKNCDLLLLKESLGHSSVMSTEIYAHLANEDYRSKLRELVN